MKFIIVLAAVIALAVAAPADSDTTVLRQSVDHVDPTGYKFELVFFILFGGFTLRVQFGLTIRLYFSLDLIFSIRS